MVVMGHGCVQPDWPTAGQNNSSGWINLWQLKAGQGVGTQIAVEGELD
jgi:uncharacterized protein involved in type VI secretion and phage assembly